MINTVALFTKISSISSATTQAQVAFYSSATPSSESFISRIDFSNADTASVLNNVPIPNNAVLAIVFNKSSVSDSVTIEGVTKVSASVRIDVDELKAFQAEFTNDLGDVVSFFDIDMKPLATIGNTYIDAQGYPHESNTWNSYVFELSGLGLSKFTRIVSSTNDGGADFYQVSFFNNAIPSQSSLVGGIKFASVGENTAENINIPDTATICYVCNRVATSTNIEIFGIVASDVNITTEKVSETAVNAIAESEGVIKPENTTFFHISGNLVAPSTIVEGEYVNQTNGSFATNASHKRTGFVPVSPGESYCIRFDTDGDSTGIRYAFYQSNNVESYISGASVLLGNIGYMLTSPINAHYMAVSIGNISSRFFIKKSDTKTNYESYGNDYILSKYISDDININIPSKIYALVGYETNIYFENLVEDWTKYQWDVACIRGMQLERGFRVTPASGETGTFDLSITAKSKSGNSIMTVKTSLIIVSDSVGSGVSKSVMILGDSTTNSGTAVTKLNENFSDDVMTVTTVGTRGTAPNLHEGRSGWRFESYFTTEYFDYTDGRGHVENPFYNPTSQTFDASHYFSVTNVIKPDWFFINLGINDMFNYTNDTELFEQIESCKTMCSAMIASMKEASSNTKIGVCLTIPPNHSQDAFGKAYKCAQNRDRYKRNNFLWVSALISEYDKRESENIYIIPIFASIDTVYNMGMETLPVNARNTTMTYESPVSNGGVHPVESGYWQIADVYTAFLKANA